MSKLPEVEELEHAMQMARAKLDLLHAKLEREAVDQQEEAGIFERMEDEVNGLRASLARTTEDLKGARARVTELTDTLDAVEVTLRREQDIRRTLKLLADYWYDHPKLQLA